jgi:hypothetical protein
MRSLISYAACSSSSLNSDMVVLIFLLLSIAGNVVRLDRRSGSATDVRLDPEGDLPPLAVVLLRLNALVIFIVPDDFVRSGTGRCSTADALL